ncbi:glycosyltransferase [Dyella sp. 2HG41-7]|uniref:glycosyltransferase n=1 Tax=Dyella sp. 2HG41-7 TaxID=2883239 RepID=UPI001F17BABD|nr:glycosyltransferase [Dyella sp. 2HG41-7]
MSVLFIGKRFYTNRDALREKYGRIYQLPRYWARSGIKTQLWLVDYHSHDTVRASDDSLDVISTPVRNLALFKHWFFGGYAQEKGVDTVVASGDCYIGWMGWRIARKLGARFMFDVYDKYDEFAGYRSLPGFDLFRYLMRKADANLFASRALMDHYSDVAKSSLLVPNGIDEDLFRPRSSTESRAAMGLTPEQKVIGYFGSLTEDRGISDLIRAIAILRERDGSVVLLLAGKREGTLQVVGNGVVYLGNLPFERVPTAMACCDVLALPYRRSPFLDMASSCKIAEYLAMELPIVATSSPNIVTNFPEEVTRLGEFIAKPSDAADLARALRAQLQAKVVIRQRRSTTWKVIADALAHELPL